MATRTSLLRYLAAALVAGFALSLAPATSALADEDPGVRAKRVYRVHAPRVVYRMPRIVHHVRTVVRTQRVCFDYAGRPFDCRMPAPVAYSSCGGCAAPAPVRVQYQPVYQPVYRPAYSGCGGCGAAAVLPAPAYYAPGYYGRPAVMPYRWAVRTAWYRNQVRYHRHAWQRHASHRHAWHRHASHRHAWHRQAGRHRHVHR